jgi:murein DD-endopeptidase MepM/ murein hydrolase activator NlpD
MAGFVYPTTTSNIGFGFGPQPFDAYEDRTWHGVFYNNFHGGIDYWGPLGYPIVASGNGVVKYAGFAVPYIGSAGGNGVVIQHGPNVKSIYGHMNTVTVGPGQVVVAGQTIGTVGQSGIANGVIHLHFEFRTITAEWGEDVEDPALFLPGGAYSGIGLGQDMFDIPWLEPLSGTIVRAALANPSGENQWSLPTAAESVTAVYADRMLIEPTMYSFSEGVITFLFDVSNETEIRADYRTG